MAQDTPVQFTQYDAQRISNAVKAYESGAGTVFKNGSPSGSIAKTTTHQNSCLLRITAIVDAASGKFEAEEIELVAGVPTTMDTAIRREWDETNYLFVLGGQKLAIGDIVLAQSFSGKFGSDYRGIWVAIETPQKRIITNVNYNTSTGILKQTVLTYTGYAYVETEETITTAGDC